MSNGRPPFDSENFQLSLRKRHLEQIRNIPLPPLNTPVPPPELDTYNDLVNWSKQAATQIENAISIKVISPNNMDWNNGIFAFMESATTYLRDLAKVHEAQRAAQEGTNEGDKRALQLLLDSQDQIKKIAKLWGLEFEVICDLVKYRPHGYWLDGPYCGVFYSTDPATPFLGLAFKGTNMKNIQEVLTDLDAVLTVAENGRLWTSPIHDGFYVTMFKEFPKIDMAPIDYIKQMIDDLLRDYHEISAENPVTLHVTGHSLGAAYALLAYAELMRLYNDDPASPEPWFTEAKKRQFVLRDLYTYGCPRSGGKDSDREDWANNYLIALNNHLGKSWRIVNTLDPVTHVPPVIPILTIWNHVDNGIQVFADAAPQALPSEVGTQPGVFIPFWHLKDHQTQSYFTSLYNTATNYD